MDPRARTASYYDLEPDFPADIPFYLGQLPIAGSRILELGCGTGRVTVPLATKAAFVQGVDLSAAMVGRCAESLRRAGLKADRATTIVADITRLALKSRFSLILAPYRVFQNLASDQEVDGFFETVRAHLAPRGLCVLNTFNPYADPASIVAKWQVAAEDLDWERSDGADLVRCYVRRGQVQPHPLVLYPELVYRRYNGGDLKEEVTCSIAMRCWYPDELHERVRAAGFRVTTSWGGYNGEAYGTGTELIVAFTEA